MAWTYSGDPSSSEVDEYRFLLGDTDPEEPILQDGEIQYIVDTYTNHNTRLFHLYDAAANYFARQIERKVGPIEEKPQERMRHFRYKANYYRDLVKGVGLSLPISSKSIFKKGMHDNARY